MRPLSTEEARRLLEQIAGDRPEALYVVALTVGLRQGELLGLRWQDLDLDGGALRVAFALQRQRAPGRLHRPRAGGAEDPAQQAHRGPLGAGRRGPAPAPVVQLEERVHAGPRWRDRGGAHRPARGWSSPRGWAPRWRPAT